MDVVLFRVQDTPCAIPVEAVAELIRAVALTPLAGTSRTIEGIFNLRGTIVPVVDVRTRLGLPASTLAPSHVFIIVHVGSRLVALRVDRVDALHNVDDTQITPALDVTPAAHYAAGVTNIDDGLIVIYDVNAFMSQAEADTLSVLIDAIPDTIALGTSLTALVSDVVPVAPL